MEYINDVAMVDNGTEAGSLAPRQVDGGFTFPTLILTNPIVVDDFKQDHNAFTYIKVHHCAFDCDTTNEKVKWWLKSQSRAYPYGHCFLYVGSNSKTENSIHGTHNVLEDNSFVWMEKETIYVVSSFTGKDGLDHAFTKVGSPSDWEVLLP